MVGQEIPFREGGFQVSKEARIKYMTIATEKYSCFLRLIEFGLAGI
jgi:hypothetical protein